jgi:hypothetical protein
VSDENKEKDEGYRTCLQEVEEVLDQALAQPQSPVHTERQPGQGSMEKGVLSQHPESMEQFDFPMNGNDQVHDDDDNSSLVRSTYGYLRALLEQMEAVAGWTCRTGGKPFIYIKPGPRGHYGWRGDGNDHVNQDREDIISTVQTPPNQKTQSMV